MLVKLAAKVGGLAAQLFEGGWLWCGARSGLTISGWSW